MTLQRMTLQIHFIQFVNISWFFFSCFGDMESQSHTLPVDPTGPYFRKTLKQKSLIVPRPTHTVFANLKDHFPSQESFNLS